MIGSKKPSPRAMPSLGQPDVSSMMQQLGQGAKGKGQSGMPGGTAQQLQQLSTTGQSGAQQGQQSTQFQPQQKPRAVGTFGEEVQRMGADVVQTIYRNFKDILGLTRPPKTPEEAAKLKQFHQGWQRLTQAEQQEAQKRLQREHQRRQMQEQEEMAKKQKAAQEKAQRDSQISAPGKKSGRARATQKLQDDRKRMGGASG